MLSTANYAARKFGVRSAMPGYIARRLCPELVIVRPNFDLYTAASRAVRAILADYDPAFTTMSLDEAFLDLTGAMATRRMPAGALVEEMRARILATTGLTASAGIAPNRMLAKICSDMNKPNGQFALPNHREAVLKFIRALPVSKVSGVGKVAEATLDAIGIATVQDLWDRLHVVKLVMTPKSFEFYLHVALGVSASDNLCAAATAGSAAGAAFADAGEKSISNERTFSPIGLRRDLELRCQELCRMVADSLAERNLAGRHVSLKLKTEYFDMRQRSMSLRSAVHTAEELYGAARTILAKEYALFLKGTTRIRLMGVRVAALCRRDGHAGPGGGPLRHGSGRHHLDRDTLLDSVDVSAAPSGHHSGAEVSGSGDDDELDSDALDGDWEGLEEFGVQTAAATAEEASATARSASASSVSAVGPCGDSTDAKQHGRDDSKCVPLAPVRGLLDRFMVRRADSDAGDAGTSGETYECCVCLRRVRVPSYAAFERHVDECLSEQAIKEMRERERERV